MFNYFKRSTIKNRNRYQVTLTNQWGFYQRYSALNKADMMYWISRNVKYQDNIVYKDNETGTVSKQKADAKFMGNLARQFPKNSSLTPFRTNLPNTWSKVKRYW